MNSLEAIIILTALLSSIGLFLGSLAYYNVILGESVSLLDAKNKANNCALLIDSFFANNATSYSGELFCSGEENKVRAKNDFFEKEAFVITRIRKEEKLEVDTSGHYR